MRSKKRNVTLFGCAALLGLGVFGVLRALNHSSLPIAQAQAITQTTDWRSYMGTPFYYWSGSDDLTYMGLGKDGKLHLLRRQGIPNAAAPASEGPLLTVEGGYPGQISPDGKWVVEWHRNKLRQNVPTFIAWDGSQRQEGQPTWGGEGIWTTDSSTMISGTWRSGTALDRFDPKTGKMQKSTVQGLEKFYMPERVDSSGRIVACSDSGFILHLSPPTTMPSINFPQVKLARIDPAHPESKPEQWTAPVPGEVDNGSFLISPSGDRILWILRGDVTPPLLKKIRSYIPGLKTPTKTGYRWLVSGLHGEEMHEVASYPYQPIQNKRVHPNPYSTPRWTPDSKHISFIYRHTLYIRPID